MPASGKGYEKGKYKCKNCGKVIKISSFAINLPKCPDCQSTKYSRIGEERA